MITKEQFKWGHRFGCSVCKSVMHTSDLDTTYHESYCEFIIKHLPCQFKELLEILDNLDASDVDQVGQRFFKDSVDRVFKLVDEIG